MKKLLRNGWALSALQAASQYSPSHPTTTTTALPSAAVQVRRVEFTSKISIVKLGGICRPSEGTEGAEPYQKQKQN